MEQLVNYLRDAAAAGTTIRISLISDTEVETTTYLTPTAITDMTEGVQVTADNYQAYIPAGAAEFDGETWQVRYKDYSLFID
jgi:hypothetical protein